MIIRYSHWISGLDFWGKKTFSLLFILILVFMLPIIISLVNQWLFCALSVRWKCVSPLQRLSLQKHRSVSGRSGGMPAPALWKQHRGVDKCASPSNVVWHTHRYGLRLGQFLFLKGKLKATDYTFCSQSVPLKEPAEGATGGAAAL